MSDDWHISMTVNGRTVKVPARAVALSLGVPHEDLIAELRANGGDMSKIPEDWKRNARRRAAETSAQINNNGIVAGLRRQAETYDPT